MLNMYASGVCSGKITPGGKKGRTKKMGGGMIDRNMYSKGGSVSKLRGCGAIMSKKKQPPKTKSMV